MTVSSRDGLRQGAVFRFGAATATEVKATSPARLQNRKAPMKGNVLCDVSAAARWGGGFRSGMSKVELQHRRYASLGAESCWEISLESMPGNGGAVSIPTRPGTRPLPSQA